MWIYRLCEARYSDRILEGEGGLRSDGRWHHAPRAVIYASTTESLAVIEARIGLGKTPPEDDYILHTIEIRDDAVQALEIADLPPDWAGRPAPHSTRAFGDEWLERAEHLALRLPSIHSHSEYNVLLNPAHPAAAGLAVIEQRGYDFDPGLFGEDA